MRPRLSDYSRRLILNSSSIALFLTFAVLTMISLGTALYFARRADLVQQEKNRSIAEQSLTSFTNTADIIGRSSHSIIALKYGDYAGYRRVVIPWVATDSRIEGFNLFDAEGARKIRWQKSGVEEDAAPVSARARGLVLEGDKILYAFDVVEGGEKLGAIQFVTDFAALGLDKLGLSGSAASDSIPFEGLPGAHISSVRGNLLAPLLVVFLFLGASGLVLLFSLQLRGRIQASQEIARIASQVSHDIRSPLSALKLITNHLEQLPEESRVLIRSAVNRINDIANNLLEENRTRSAERGTAVKDVVVPELLYGLVDAIVSEKRAQYRSRTSVTFQFRCSDEAMGLFAAVGAIQCKRVLSNLIDNAVEAILDAGQVVVTVSHVGGFVEIEVADTGMGIPHERIARLGRRGESFGKVRGTGLGLYHARTSAELWGGSLRITSQEGKGTQVLLRLPKTKTPTWFVAKLQLAKGSTVVILDDDSSIHGVWDARFGMFPPGTVEIVHFSRSQPFVDWVLANGSSQKVSYLVDYELLGESTNGLALIEKLGIEKHSILVSSRHEEPNVRAACERLRVGILPKALAPFVAIEIG